MTLQDAFNVIWSRSKIHVKSLCVENNQCQYRIDGGLPCFAGVLIDDEHYTPSLEGNTAENIEVASTIERSGYPPSSMYQDAQYMHDHWDFHQWDEGLRLLAKRYDVSVPE